LNSVREEKDDDDLQHSGYNYMYDQCDDNSSDFEIANIRVDDHDSDLVVGFPSVPRRSSEALAESRESGESSTSHSPAVRRSSLKSSSSHSKAQINVSNQHKSVRFILPKDDPFAIHYIESAFDMSPNEISELWITAAERAEINRRNNDTVHSMRRSRSENDLNHLGQSSRGLEHLQSSRVLRALARAQRDLIDAVLHLQSVQRKNTSFHEHCHEREENFARDLGLLARQMSKSACARAIEVAEADAATAALIAAIELQEATQLTPIPQERPPSYLHTIRPASTTRFPPPSFNHATTRQACLANLQETLELGVMASDNRSETSFIQSDKSIGSLESPPCF
jgi:hypothetical protein